MLSYTLKKVILLVKTKENVIIMCTVLEFLFLIGCFEDMDIFCDFNSGLIGSFIYDKYSQNYKFTGVSSGSSGVDLSVKAIQSEVSNFYMTS